MSVEAAAWRWRTKSEEEDAVVAGGAAPRRGRGLVLPLSTPRTSRFSQLAPSQQLTEKNANTPNKERETQL